MKSIRYAIASAMHMVSTQAVAATPQERQVSTTADLTKLCSVSAGVDGTIELAQAG